MRWWISYHLPYKRGDNTNWDRSIFQNALALSIEMLRKIWKPDTFVYNGKKSYLHTITTPNRFVRFLMRWKIFQSWRENISGCFPMEGFCIPSVSPSALTASWTLKIFPWTDRDVHSRLDHVSCSRIFWICKYVMLLATATISLSLSVKYYPQIKIQNTGTISNNFITLKASASNLFLVGSLRIRGWFTRWVLLS